jgi:diaminohydroxyphosphoribosylaminopyrimidine deaminase/5-amino-6-(5-phosphoribosylamino)uracil reductase
VLATNSVSQSHQEWIAHAINISKAGLAHTYPNPIVGAVLVDQDNNLISQGVHLGGEHAEVIAINNARDNFKGDLSKATLYVSLEPCNHFGKTPPCTQAIIKSGVKKVFFALTDPNPIAKGGAKALEQAGIEVIGGLLTEYAQEANRDWLTKIKLNRPRIILKIATTLDGKIAAVDKSSKWITSQPSRNDVARLRSQADAIITTTGTVRTDDPELTSKGLGKDPAVFVVGKSEISPESKLRKTGADLTFVKSYEIDQLIGELNKRGFNRVMVEAGPSLITSLLKAQVVDEVIIYQAPTLLADGTSFVSSLGITTIGERIDFEIKDVQILGSDIKTTLYAKVVR